MINDLRETLYKYRDWENPYHKRILTHNEFYFSSPKEFNDPFDSNIRVRYDLRGENKFLQELIRIIRKNKPSLSLKKVRKEAENILAIQKEHPQKISEIMKNNFYKIVCNQSGILCLTKNINSIIMWSHYANSHKGFCVGFKTSKIIELIDCFRSKYLKLYDLDKVDYKKEYPKIDKFTLSGNEINKIPLTIKSSEWTYEEEYRLILITQEGYIVIEKSDRNIVFGNDLFDSIYLGYKMEKNIKIEIIEIIKEKQSDIKIYQCSLKDEEFGLKFEPV